MATVFAMVLGLVMQLASLYLAVTGFQHVNGLFLPLVLGFGGTVLFWWPMMVTGGR